MRKSAYIACLVTTIAGSAAAAEPDHPGPEGMALDTAVVLADAAAVGLSGASLLVVNDDNRMGIGGGAVFFGVTAAWLSANLAKTGERGDLAVAGMGTAVGLGAAGVGTWSIVRRDPLFTVFVKPEEGGGTVAMAGRF